MEFVETPTFWCPHVDRVACNNFSTRTVKLRPSKRLEILLFFLFPFLSFYFPFLRTLFPTNCFLFVCLFVSFFFFFLFLLSSHFSHHFFFSPSFLLIFSFAFLFLPIFGSPWSIRSREEASSPFPHAICVALIFFSLFPYFFL